MQFKLQSSLNLTQESKVYNPQPGVPFQCEMKNDPELILA